jgi:DNA replication protein DnaC
MGRPPRRSPQRRSAPRRAHPPRPGPLVIIDEVGYIPFEAAAANLFFQFVSARYERASVIVTSNKPFGRWGKVFGDAVVAAAMIDRLVHHADVVSLKGDSYRLKDRDLGRVPTDNTE